MSAQMRMQILFHLDEHSRGPDKGGYVDDSMFARLLGADLNDVQIAMDILEQQELTYVANSMDGRSALISPRGTLVVEEARATA